MWVSYFFIKYIYSEKATKFGEIFTLLTHLFLSYVLPVKSKVKILQNYVAFSEYKNFKPNFCRLSITPFQKILKFPLKFITCRQKPTYFCIPELETPQPILPYWRCFYYRKNCQRKCWCSLVCKENWPLYTYVQRYSFIQTSACLSQKNGQCIFQSFTLWGWVSLNSFKIKAWFYFLNFEL